MRHKEARNRTKLRLLQQEQERRYRLNSAIQELVKWADKYNGILPVVPAEFVVYEPLTTPDLKQLTALPVEVAIGECDGKLVISTGSFDSAFPRQISSERFDVLAKRHKESARALHTHPRFTAHRPSLEDYVWGIDRQGDPECLIDSTGIIVYSSAGAQIEHIDKFELKINNLRGMAQYSWDDRIRDFGLKSNFILADVHWGDKANLPEIVDWLNMQKSWEDIGSRLRSTVRINSRPFAPS